MSEQPTSSTSSPPAQAVSPSSTEAKDTSSETKAKSENPFFDIDEVVEEPRSTSNDAPAVNLSTRPTSSSPPSGNTENVPTDPTIAELKAMFPDYDDIILQSVLSSANGNQAAAIEILLGMSDPNYKPETPAPQATGMSQEELDEQLARRLMLEEQEQQQIRWSQSGSPGLGPQRRNSRYDQPQPTPPHSAGAASGDKDTMAEIQEQFTKVAEVGKKTFGNIFTKVKAKIQEFERGGSNPAPPSAQWVGGYDPQAYPHETNYAPYQHHGAGQQASYYDPNSPITLSTSQTSSPPQAVPAPAVQSHDATPDSNTPARTSGSPPAAQPASSSTVPPPNPASAPIDGGKLGLLPKKPVSLIRDPPSGQQQRHNDSDDDLEYAENPFEDRKK